MMNDKTLPLIKKQANNKMQKCVVGSKHNLFLFVSHTQETNKSTTKLYRAYIHPMTAFLRVRVINGLFYIFGCFVKNINGVLFRKRNEENSNV
jgi:hypothetical protein